jgi:hypothetical protein
MHAKGSTTLCLKEGDTIEGRGISGALNEPLIRQK